MDEDPFGASVWATTTSSPPSTSKLTPKLDDTFTPPPQQTRFGGSDPFTFNDDDFDTSEPIVASTSPFQPDFTPDAFSADNAGDDDDFGDFGEFGDAEDAGGFDSYQAEDDPSANLPSNSFTDWKPLSLDPFPDIDELDEAVADITRPIWGEWTAFTDEPIRETEGVSKILTTTESRTLYQSLLTSPPPVPLPPSWTRSRIRRQYLIALGIPVNLDEVMPSLPNGKALPRLEVTTRPASAPPGPRNHEKMRSNGGGSRGPGTPVNGATLPKFDQSKIDALLSVAPETLPLLPLSVLEGHLASLAEARASVTEHLTELLQKRESLRQDNETYHGLIGELVGEAQKRKMTRVKGRTASLRRDGRR